MIVVHDILAKSTPDDPCKTTTGLCHRVQDNLQIVLTST